MWRVLSSPPNYCQNQASKSWRKTERVEWKSYLCHQTLTFLLTKNHTTIRKVPLGQGKNRGWLWHEKSIICKVWPRGLSSCSLGRDALAGSTVHNRVNVNHYRTCAIISCRLCGFSPNVKSASFFCVAPSRKFHWYLRTLSLKFQKARTKIEVFPSLPCWLSQLDWDSQQGRDRKTKFCIKVAWSLGCLMT